MQSIWEIGPGLGSLTHELIGRARSVTVFEIDHGFSRFLRSRFGRSPGFKLVAGDFISSFPEEMAQYGVPDRIVGNLPYSSASAMIMEMAAKRCVPPRAVFTVQREAAERMYAGAGTKEYSILSVVCRAMWRVASLGRVKPGSFYPPPRVESEIVLLERRTPVPVLDPALLIAVCRTIFGSRRKTIRNNIRDGIVGLSYETAVSAFERVDIPVDSRAEGIDPDRLSRLAVVLDRVLHCGTDEGGNSRA